MVRTRGSAGDTSVIRQLVEVAVIYVELLS